MAGNQKPEYTDGEAYFGLVVGLIVLAIAGYFISRPFFNWKSGDTELTRQVKGQEAVLSRLRDPASAEFSGMTTYGNTVCGWVNSKNGFGGMAGAQRFVADNGFAVIETDVGKQAFAPIWADKCK